ncbi:hypothetical protein [Thermaerobacillus caldiproteolyticus]|uniref:Uncharacterized protein n=1 Tax=Thermaerobacillus caldiproteolyticus TaxID=247480 RepID=A0A7V9Z765_9BACL|nr:hypothetical protein [Anoxybacillus caldiproteolyticus]MBA2875190.1 hypothetical protein [Anoxybacillus caldiproteolyticus]QPA32863.1 hypothetical protein ISX45_08190 [Anoxybacillus caldiproteolyticus]
MLVHELIGTEHLFTGQLKKGYHILLKKYKTSDVRLFSADYFQEIDCGTEEVVEVVFDPGNEYSLVCLGLYTFKNESPSLHELQRTLQSKHQDIFQKEAVSA